TPPRTWTCAPSSPSTSGWWWRRWPASRSPAPRKGGATTTGSPSGNTSKPRGHGPPATGKASLRGRHGDRRAVHPGRRGGVPDRPPREPGPPLLRQRDHGGGREDLPPGAPPARAAPVDGGGGDHHLPGRGRGPGPADRDARRAGPAGTPGRAAD